MRFYKIDCQDKIIVQRVSGVPATTDKGRISFDTVSNELLIDNGSSVERVLAGDKPVMSLTINDDVAVLNDNLYTIGDSTKGLAAVYAVDFNGEALTAKWGDVAEKYVCKGNCKVGTLMSVCLDNDIDVEECDQDLSPIYVGVISENPGIKINDGLEGGKYVGLVGKLPVRVRGPVYKGDFLVPTYEGCARAGHINELPYKIGISLEKDLSDGEKLINCIIK